MFNVSLQRQFAFGSRSLSSSQRMARAPLGDSLLRSSHKATSFAGALITEQKSYTKGLVKVYEWRESAIGYRTASPIGRPAGYWI